MAGLYIHIPFCKSRCYYCDFTTYAGMEKFMPAYLVALETEINQSTKGVKLDTIFIGGGTPTSLDDDSFRQLMAIIKSLVKGKTQEITIEANPESLTPEKVQMMKDGGINRVSMGLQSTDDLILKNIGRIHNYDTFIKGYELLRQNGFDNLSFDLITALPGQDEAIIRNTIQQALALAPEHISVYSMILEETTPFYDQAEAGTLILPDDETDRLFQDLFRIKLEAAGYVRYEISNYALPGRACRHNLNYWNLGEYIGCGVAASGFMDGVRWTNTSSIEDYIEGIQDQVSVRTTEHINSMDDSMEEFVFMGLRKTEGISLDKFWKRFGSDFFEVYPGIAERFISTGFMVKDGDRLYLTNAGLDISSYIMSDFILTEGEDEAEDDD